MAILIVVYVKHPPTIDNEEFRQNIQNQLNKLEHGQSPRTTFCWEEMVNYK